MLQDWIAREGWIVVNYWLLLTALGVSVLPLLLSLFPGLPDRGYTLARPAGLLLVAFVFWLLVVLGFLDNSVGSILVAWVVVIGLGVIAYRRYPVDLRDWWGNNRPLIIVTEVLFIVLLVGFSLFRAHQNELRSTEKPMDLAFMSAIQQSETFPPNDPWLSDYAISYYYFGYVMSAMNADIVGVPSAIGYGMHLAVLFALVGTASMGIVYNLVRRSTRLKPQNPSGSGTAIGFGLLGMVFLLFMSNFQPLVVEIPFQNRWFDDSYYEFWDTKGLSSLPRAADGESYQPPRNILDPDDISQLGWWWFNASRTITERSITPEMPPGDYVDGVRINEVIDEFPAFSFILGDSHPHVMALPFALLAIGLALNLIFTTRITPPQVVLYGICVGALVFLNTWDAPIYIVVFGLVALVRQINSDGRLTFNAILNALALAGVLAVIMIVAYFPFLAGFRSQLSGVLPNVMHPTRPQQLFLMFAPFIIMLSVYLGVEAWRGRLRQMMNWPYAAVAALMVVVFLGLFNALLLSFNVYARDYADVIRLFLESGDGWSEITDHIVARRLVALPGLAAMMFILTLVAARLFPTQDWRETDAPYPLTTGFVLVLIGAGVGLVLVPEFVYLRDNFGWRMNTVFKFYYQAWALFSIAAAYGVYSIVADVNVWRPAMIARLAYSAVVVIVVGLGSFYFIGGIYSRASVEADVWNVREGEEQQFTLDGGPRFTHEEDYDAIMCLADLVGDETAVVAEARPEGSYNPNAGRVGSLTGLPVVVGWENHQSQWRGTSWLEARGTRPEDMDLLYQSLAIGTAQPIIERYGIDYIIYGRVERRQYGASGEQKFLDHYTIVCEEIQIIDNISRVARVYAVGEG